jgi:hypothetical protein
MHRSRSVIPSEPPGSDLPPDGEARGPDGPDVPDAPGTNGEPATPGRVLIPGIDLDSVALEEDYEQALAADEAHVVVVRKASGQGYFRAHPTLHRNIWALEIKNGADRGYYIVAGEAKKVLHREEHEDIKLFPCRLTLCYARDSGLFLWPLRLPEEGRKNQMDEWGQTALRICALAETAWVKLYTRRGGNCYSHKVGEGITAQPPWPEGVTLNELAGIAFEGKFVTDAADPLVRRLLGKE